MEQAKQDRPGTDPFGGRYTRSPQQRFRPAEKVKDKNKVLRRLLGIYTLFKGRLILVVLLTVIASLASLLAPFLIGKAVDCFDLQTLQADRPRLLSITVLLFLCYLTSWLATSVSRVLIETASQKMIHHIRQEFMAKLSRLPLVFYDERQHGDLMSRLTNDTDNISSIVSEATTQLLSSSLVLTGSMAMMVYLSPLLALTVLGFIPVVMLLTAVVSRKSRILFKEQADVLGRLNGLIQEHISGLKMVKIFDRRENVLQSFSASNEKLYGISVRANIVSGMLNPIINMMNNLIFALVAFTGGVLALRSGLNVGTVVSFLAYAKQFNRPLNQIASTFSSIQRALAGAERIFEILDEKEQVPDPAEVRLPVQANGKIEFSGVTFGYRAEPVLREVSFRIEPGEVVALVGETGAGKTTIASLLVRFYETGSGRILIDDTDIRSIPRDELHRYFSAVLQDTNLFSGTILDNIRYARPEASEEEAIEAAKHACAHEFIMRLPQNYHTRVSGSTDALSQGQKQLLSIARAFLGDAPILIFDEATSNVDTKTERRIQKAMFQLLQGRTCLLIAHRLSTIRYADRIMVVGNAGIAESGIHEELMQKDGIYAAMVKTQTQG